MPSCCSTKAGWGIGRDRRDIENRPVVAAQAYGEALDPARLTTLSRYETHLDRKLEKTLAMLLKLRELREDRADAD